MFITLLGNITTKWIFSMLPLVLMILTPLLIRNHIFYQRERNKKKRRKNAKLGAWKSLAEPLKSHTPQGSVLKRETITSEKANLFRNVVAHTLPQYDIKK